MQSFRVKPLPVAFSVLSILTICQVIPVSANGSTSRLTRRPGGSLSSTLDHEKHPPRHRLLTNNETDPKEVEDQKSDPSSHSVRLLPPPDIIINSFLSSPHAQLASQRNSPPKGLIHGVLQSLRDGSGTSVRSGRRLTVSPQKAPQQLSPPPPVPQRQSLRPRHLPHQYAASLSIASPSFRHDIVPLMPALDHLGKHVIPVGTISKDIESAIQKIVQDIVDRRDKIFYQLPNSVYDNPRPTRGRSISHKEKQRQVLYESDVNGDEFEREPMFRSRPPLRHLPPPPSVHRGLYSSTSSSSPGNERPAGNELRPYYASAKNGLGAGLRSLADYVKSLKAGNRGFESENEGYSYAPQPSSEREENGPASGQKQGFSPPASTFTLEMPDGLELPVPDPSSPVNADQRQPYEGKDDLNILHSDWISVHNVDNAQANTAATRPEREVDDDEHETRQMRSPNAYQQPLQQNQRTVFVQSGSRPSESGSSFDQENPSQEQMRINREVLLPLFESLLGESDNSIGVYIPKPVFTTSPPSPSQSSLTPQPSEKQRSFMTGGGTQTATTSYSSDMAGIRSVRSAAQRKNKPCPGK